MINDLSNWQIVYLCLKSIYKFCTQIFYVEVILISAHYYNSYYMWVVGIYNIKT